MSVHPTFRGVSFGLEVPSLSRKTDPIFFSGEGAPSGGVLPTGQVMDSTQAAVYFRRDGTASTFLYVTVNGGTNWTAADPAALSTLDLNGTELILDADGNTSITADTDDQIDVKIGGADDFKFTANLFSVLSGSHVLLADSSGAKFGDGSDIVFSWDGTRLNVTQAATNSEIRWGVDGAGIDQVWYGDTASQKATWDQSADALVLTAAVSITGQGSTVVPLIPIAAAQALSGAGAINITTYRTNWTTTAANAGTLANGAQIGQLKRIQMVADGGDGTLTPTSLSGGTTITFADAGDYAVLCWSGTAWVAIELGNDADGVTAPVLA
jgi:hypothetical protein